MPTLTTHLAQQFRATRAATLRFCQPLTPEDLMVQSCPEASPLKWHLAHTTWFFETFVLSEFSPAYQSLNPDFRWLFNSYYNAVGDQPEKKLRASFSRPSLEAILAYRTHVDAAIDVFLNNSPSIEALRRITLGLHHEQQHLELAAYDIKHALFTNPLHPAYIEKEIPAPTATTPLQWLTFNPGLTEIGVNPDPDSSEAFSFDNETPRHQVFLAPFRIASRLVTVAEYLAFLNDNAYARPELWLSAGWDAVRAHNWQAPLYWQRNAEAPSGWRIYTLHGWRTADQLAITPVCHVSHFEADAYARWSGHRLPTEFEWEHAASTITHPNDPACNNLLDSGNLHPTPAKLLDLSPRSEAGGSASLQQIYGDVWEWTASPYTGYPGYHPLPGALGEYNGKFMSSQMVLRGGSCVTPAGHLRPTYRNFFSPETRWHFAGLRLAK